MDNHGYECCFCNQRFGQLLGIQEHLRNFHDLERNRGRRCGINNCEAVFQTPQALRSHKSRVHRPVRMVDNNFQNIEEHQNENERGNVDGPNRPLDANNFRMEIDNEQRDDEVIEEADSASSSNDETDEEEEADDQEEAEDNDPGVNDERKRALGRFLLHLRGNTNISEEKITDILTLLQNIVRTYVGNAFHQVEAILQERGINLGEFMDIENETQSTNCIFDFKNKKKRAEYLETEFQVLMPTRHILGRRFVKYGNAALGKDRPTKRKTDEMMFIPITDIFRKFAANDSFQNVFKYHDSQDGIYASFEDGSRYKNETWWKNQEEAIHIKLYCDEVDMCDGLGSKASGKQKLLMFYCSFLDIDEIYQSSLLFNFIVAIVRSEDVKRYGLMKILRLIVDNIKEFEEGLELPNGTTQKGGLFATVGDNLAQNSMCGLIESFGRSLHPCRVCLAGRAEIQTLTEEIEDLLRNSRSHDAQVLEIENAVGQDKERLITAYGIKVRSILNELRGFHITEGAPPDIIHDLILTLIPRTLQNFAQKKILREMSLQKLNELILNFDYGYSETKHKPSPLKPQHLVPGSNIKQNAMQMITLAYIIPYIVRDVVETDCPYFYNYRNLLEMTAIVFGYSISSDMIEFLSDSIAEYLSDYASLYGNDDGDEPFIPKQHFLSHFPEHIKIFGPLRHFMCLRFEAKHQEFKRIVDGMRNYTNLPYTFAVRHQYSQAEQLLDPLTKTTVKGPTKLVATGTLPFYNLYPEDQLSCVANWVNYNGVKYISNKCLIAVGFSNAECLPGFAALHSIVLRGENVEFVCKTVETVSYNSELVAYEVIINEEFVSVNPENLVNHEVFHLRKSKGKFFVTVKNCFGDLY